MARDWRAIPRAEFTAAPEPETPAAAPADPVGTLPLCGETLDGIRRPMVPVHLPDDVAAWIDVEVIRPVGSMVLGPHHSPIWGAECGRCAPAVCRACTTEWGPHKRCTGHAWPWYAESDIYGAGPWADRIDPPERWADGAWRLWLVRPCGCGCDPAAERARADAARERGEAERAHRQPATAPGAERGDDDPEQVALF